MNARLIIEGIVLSTSIEDQHWGTSFENLRSLVAPESHVWICRKQSAGLLQWALLLSDFLSLTRQVMMVVRGIRGATSVETDEPAEILEATRELLAEVLRLNAIDDYEEIVSAIFTTTHDLTSTFPAEAARKLGMTQVPLLCAMEIPVQGSMPKCIRVLLHVNTEKKQAEMTHVYLREARRLRPDVVSAQ